MLLQPKPEQLRVLIVEDSEDDCQFLVHYLRKQGFDFSHLRIQTEIEMTHALQQNWDVILSDYSMPKFSGPHAFELLKSTARDIPFIIISGTVGEDIAVEIMRTGVSDYILKSNLSRLGPALRRELDSARARANHRATEKMLSNTEEQLRQSQKMEAIGQLAGGIAHDFNNMLSVMQIYCHKIKQSHDSVQIKNCVDKILSVHARSVALTKQLLIFSRRQPTTSHPIKINNVIQNMRDMLDSLIGSQNELVIDLASELPAVISNEGQLEQVILNLAVNARDAMISGGKIAMKTYQLHLPEAKRVKSAVLPEGHYVVVEVKDSGSGISPQNIDRIFEPFFTTKPSGQGTGLGLAIIYGIVHQYGGGIDIQSELTKGTQFKLYFPVFHGEVMPTVAPQGEVKLTRKAQTILLVEDEFELRSLISEILCQEGYKVIEANNGEEALQIFSSEINKIDLVITDMMMPKLDGSEFHKKILSSGSVVPFIYMSGFFKESIPDNFPFLEKPFTNQALLATIQKVFGSQKS